MLERVGHNNLSQLLDYYESLGWINKNFSERLIDLAEAEEQRYAGPSWTLSAEEHRISMIFIEKLRGKSVKIPPISIIVPLRAKTELVIITPPRESYLEAHRIEKNELELAVHRREVTIKNLEEELIKKDIEIGKHKETIRELEYQLNEYKEEDNKNRIYRGILEENVRLKKLDFYRK
ncbi:Archaeal flagella protein [uncultured archaeon]|nr:Archaeal flagella protein [uncultured archaeon]